jgi:hypothetical protein
MRTLPAIGAQVEIKGYHGTPFKVVDIERGTGTPVRIAHPFTGATMLFALRELEPHGPKSAPPSPCDCGDPRRRHALRRTRATLGQKGRLKRLGECEVKGCPCPSYEAQPTRQPPASAALC